MGRGSASAVHMQCTSTPCRKRFKGHPGDPCPRCGKNAKPNVHTNTKPWRKNMCGCHGQVYTPKETFTAHRKGSKGCIHEGGDVPMQDMPGTGEEYPF